MKGEMMEKKGLISIAVLILFITSSLASCGGRKLSKEQIVQIATKAAETEGFNLKWLTVIYDEENKRWKERVKGIEYINREMVPPYKFLKKKNYQAVCFAPKAGVLGGDVWFFIDKKTGGLLTFYVEK